MTSPSLRLALTLGDPAGIGPEIAARLVAEQAGSGDSLPPLLLIGTRAVWERACGLVGARLAPPQVLRPGEGSLDGAVQALLAPVALLDDPEGAPPAAYGQVSEAAGRDSHRWVTWGAGFAQRGAVGGLVTGPIHKAAWHRAGVPYAGHTELLKDLAKRERVLMMLAGGGLRTVLATTHVALRQVPDLIDREALTSDLVLLDRCLREGLGLPSPRIAVCGLNPHAGDGGLMGHEDARVIAPAIADARARGVGASGPWPADACIPQAARGSYDAVFAMYHDQALPAVKALAQREGVNVTLGLPYVRTSVDHGTAFDIAGQGLATAISLHAAVRTAVAWGRPEVT